MGALDEDLGGASPVRLRSVVGGLLGRATPSTAADGNPLGLLSLADHLAPQRFLREPGRYSLAEGDWRRAFYIYDLPQLLHRHVVEQLYSLPLPLYWKLSWRQVPDRDAKGVLGQARTMEVGASIFKANLQVLAGFGEQFRTRELERVLESLESEAQEHLYRLTAPRGDQGPRPSRAAVMPKA